MITNIDYEEDFRNSLKIPEYCLVAFHASWSGPCNMMKSKLGQFSRDYPKLKYFMIDVDSLDTVAAEAGISAMPTYQIYSWGRVVDQLVGASADKLEAFIKRYHDLPPVPEPEYKEIITFVDRSGDAHYERIRVK